MLAVTLVFSTPAAAYPSDCSGSGTNLHTVQVWGSGGHQIVSRAYGYPCTYSREWWDNFRQQESTQWWDTVCRTQGYLDGNQQNVRLYYEYTSQLSGCQLMLKFYDFPNWDSYYPDDIYFGNWWRSDATGGGWQAIGVIQR